MLMTKRKPVTVGEMLIEEFMEPLGITQTELAEQTGLPRKHVNELCRNRRAVTADTALILGRVFGNSADFWLNTQRRTDLWEALHTPQRFTRIKRAQPLGKRRLAVTPQLYKAITAAPVPVDLRARRALKRSPLKGRTASGETETHPQLYPSGHHRRDLSA
jgi:addiction module HigA family antidote